MKKILMMLGLLVLSNTVLASPLVSHLPEVKVPVTSPSNRLVQKEGGFGAQMYWSKEPHTRAMENVFVSAAFKDTALRVKDSDNLVYSITDLVDEGLRNITLEKTPYIKLKEKTNSLGALSAEIQKYDAGLLFYVDNQINGEVGLHVFLRDTHTGEVFGHYTARIEYNEDKSIEGKKAAFVHGVKRFAREFDRFRNGERAVSEEIYQVR